MKVWSALVLTCVWVGLSAAMGTFVTQLNCIFVHKKLLGFSHGAPFLKQSCSMDISRVINLFMYMGVSRHLPYENTFFDQNK
jgi:hypothetical protein